MELYEEARYFTMTGAHLSITPGDILDRSEVLAAVNADVLADQGETDPGSANAAAVRESPGESMGIGSDLSISDSSAPETAESWAESGTTSLDDSELSERAAAAANGEKFQRLWSGDTSGYPSQSEADMALCCLLAFWTGWDSLWMDRLFRRSDWKREIRSIRNQGLLWGVIVAPLGTRIVAFLLNNVVAGGSSCGF